MLFYVRLELMRRGKTAEEQRDSLQRLMNDIAKSERPLDKPSAVQEMSTWQARSVETD